MPFVAAIVLLHFKKLGDYFIKLNLVSETEDFDYFTNSENWHFILYKEDETIYLAIDSKEIREQIWGGPFEQN